MLCSFDIVSTARQPPASWVLISSGTDNWYNKAERAPREQAEPTFQLCCRQFTFIIILRNSQALWVGIHLRIELLPFPGEVGKNATVLMQQVVDDYRLWCAPNLNGWQLICVNVDLIDIKPKLLSFLNALHSVMKDFWQKQAQRLGFSNKRNKDKHINGQSLNILYHTCCCFVVKG